jgi:2,3-bisphosphoglycerate-dependent phosphoglycerate mutase
MSSALEMADALRPLEAAYLFSADGSRLPEATEVWLVRHGDCYAGQGRDRSARGDDDPPLSARGRQQARRLGERIRRVGVTAVYSSPLRRAVETARSMTDRVEIEPRLTSVATALDQNGLRREAEDPGQVIARMGAAVADAVATHPGRRVVMVGHGVAITTYLTHIMGLEFGLLRLPPYFASVNIVLVSGDHQMVGSLADVSHLEGP